MRLNFISFDIACMQEDAQHHEISNELLHSPWHKFHLTSTLRKKYYIIASMQDHDHHPHKVEMYLVIISMPQYKSTNINLLHRCELLKRCLLSIFPLFVKSRLHIYNTNTMT